MFAVYSFKIEVVIVLKMTFKKRKLKFRERKNLGWLEGLRQHCLTFFGVTLRFGFGPAGYPGPSGPLVFFFP